MKLLLDEDMPLRSAALLREAGVDALHVLERRLGGTPDERLLSIAEREGAVICTLDSDFHRLLAISGATQPSVIRVRLEGLNYRDMGRLLTNVIESAQSSLEQGAVVSVTHQIRIRQLPIPV